MYVTCTVLRQRVSKTAAAAAASIDAFIESTNVSHGVFGLFASPVANTIPHQPCRSERTAGLQAPRESRLDVDHYILSVNGVPTTGMVAADIVDLIDKQGLHLVLQTLPMVSIDQLLLQFV